MSKKFKPGSLIKNAGFPDSLIYVADDIHWHLKTTGAFSSIQNRCTHNMDTDEWQLIYGEVLQNTQPRLSFVVSKYNGVCYFINNDGKAFVINPDGFMKKSTFFPDVDPFTEENSELLGRMVKPVLSLTEQPD